MDLPTKHITSSTEQRDDQKTHKIIMDGEDILVGEYKKWPAFVGYHVFAPAGYIERYMEVTIFRFHETKKDDPMMATKNLF